MDEIGCEDGLGVVVDGEEEDRGIELISRSNANGRVFRIRGGSAGVEFAVDVGGDVDVDVDVGGRNGCEDCDDFSSQAARAEGSTGQADGGEGSSDGLAIVVISGGR